MPIREPLRMALEALTNNKLRSSLTMLGIVIGVAAVIAMVALGRGAQRSVNERISALGTTLITVVPGQIRNAGGVASAEDRTPLTLDDAKFLEDRGLTMSAVQPEMARSLQVQYRNANANTTITGTTANYTEVRRFTVAAGRMFTDAEDQAKRRVAVVGAQVLTNLGIADPLALIGEPIRIAGTQFEVVGVLASKGQGGGFANPDDQVLVPIETAQYRVLSGDRLRTINVLAPDEATIPQTMAEIQRLLRRAHHLRTGQANDFDLRNQSDFLATLGQTTQVFTALLAGIAAVSLLVGGIGIMNIMLVSVTERTREIGIRKALGATQRTILLQFLLEALVLCLLGGLAGVVLGGGSAIGLRALFHWPTAVGPDSVVIAFTFAALVGVGFGVWPARRAASLDPIQSLRYE